MQALVKRWRICIESNGDYAEERESCTEHIYTKLAGIYFLIFIWLTHLAS
jgi:hypothetical protein